MKEDITNDVDEIEERYEELKNKCNEEINRQEIISLSFDIFPCLIGNRLRIIRFASFGIYNFIAICAHRQTSAT